MALGSEMSAVRPFQTFASAADFRESGRSAPSEHWRWPVAMQKAMKVQPVLERLWTNGDYHRPELYAGVDPLPGVFATLEQAEREVRAREEFSDAIERR